MREGSRRGTHPCTTRYRVLLRQIQRWLRRFQPAPARFVFDPQYELSVSAAPMDPHRADNIITFLASEGMVRPADVLGPRPATLESIRKVHQDDYLEGLNEPGALTSILGVEVSEAEQNQTLNLQRLMVGGTLKAVRLARTKGVIGINLGGGFHHARPNRGQGFCVFNDVAVSIAREREEGFSAPVLVIDLDMHDGDGTRRVFARDPSVHTFSIHNQHLDDVEAVASTAVALGPNVKDDQFLAALQEHLPRVLESVKPGLVIYVAGVDGAADDRLGNWRLSANGMLARDQLVLSLVRDRSLSIPMAVVLAGGYGKSAWRYSARFFAYLLSGQVLEPPGWEDMTILRFRHLQRLLDPAELTGSTPPSSSGDDLELTEADLLGDLQPVRREPRFLGYYSAHGMELVLERYGLFKQLRAMAFRNPSLSLDLADPDKHMIRIFGNQEKTDLLMELQLRRDRRAIPRMELLNIEWLLLQNPRRSFSDVRPQLPGQKHPGLGLLAEVVGVLVMICDRLKLDGLVFVPSHYHVAAQSVRHLRFLHPADEENFRAIKLASTGMSLAEASRALEEGQLMDSRTCQPLKWKPGPMIYPISPELCEQMALNASRVRNTRSPTRTS